MKTQLHCASCRIMREYMPKRGTLGHDMMFRSCTIQVKLMSQQPGRPGLTVNAGLQVDGDQIMQV